LIYLLTSSGAPPGEEFRQIAKVPQDAIEKLYTKQGWDVTMKHSVYVYDPNETVRRLQSTGDAPIRSTTASTRHSSQQSLALRPSTQLLTLKQMMRARTGHRQNNHQHI
jgi:hypothetical protein